MSGQPWLDWTALSLSLFNAFLLLWLGLTILLETNRRSLGVWLAADGLFLGAVFFLAHSSILENGIKFAFPAINFWWQVGWWPVILSPFAWYSVILWFTGYWDDPSSKMHIRQAPWFGLILVFSAGLLGWMLLDNPLPDIGVRSSPTPAFSVLAFVFPIYIILCILLALDAILRPGPSSRVMGDAARRRARPWLTVSTLVLLFVSLLVTLALVWGVSTLQSENASGKIFPETYYYLTIFDLVIDLLISIAILLIGQAAIMYEVFTSHPLPRSGLRKRWILAILAGVTLSTTIAGAWVFTVRTEFVIFAILPILAGVMTIQNQIAAREQTREAKQLHTMAQSDRTYEKIFLTRNSGEQESDFQSNFSKICNEFIKPAKAVLVPIGVLSNFLPGVVSFPAGINPPSGSRNRLKGDGTIPNKYPVSLNPDVNEGFLLAVPLQSSRGLEGWLYLTEQLNNGFYTMEEINLVKAACERLMDVQTAAEVARRLVAIQKNQQIETRLLDQKSRQVLHDDILPLLHTALLTELKRDSNQLITLAHKQISQLLRELPPPPPAEIARDGLIIALQKIAHKEASILQANLKFNVNSKAEAVCLNLPVQTAETVYYAFRECLRNIQRHTQLTDDKSLEIKITIQADGILWISIENNGVGGENSTLPSSGQGLALHNALLTIFGGGLRLETTKTGNSRVLINLPVPD